MSGFETGETVRELSVQCGLGDLSHGRPVSNRGGEILSLWNGGRGALKHTTVGVK